MDRVQHQRLDPIRRRRSELDNHLIDEFLSGYISRREFVRRATVMGIGLPTVGAILAACGSSSAAAPAVTTKKGGKMTVAVISPSGAIDPLTIEDEGGLVVLGQAAEYLTWSDKDLHLRPVLATSWSANADGSVWTFKIRPNVTFNDGTPMTARDVAATMNTHADPANKGNALSVFTGVLSKGGATATDDTTVVFHLDAPNGSFPYLVSSDNYNVVILPASFDYGKKGGYEASFIGTGPWKMTKFTTGTGVSFVKNANYWDKGVPNLDSLDMTFFEKDQPRMFSLQGGTSQVISQFSAFVGQALFNDSSVTLYQLRSSAHRQVHMRVDQAPFTDKRVRQAIALILNRPQLLSLLNGKAEVGNDSPFWPVFPSADTSVAQRAQDVNKAKQLLSAAGVTSGNITLYTWDNYEIPALAQAIQSAAQQVGFTITPSVKTADDYYSNFWLNSNMGITDYGHRGVPNVFLSAPLLSTGTWNAAHYANPSYDQLVKQFVAAGDLQSERRLARQIEELLLDETPIIFPYFYSHMSATANTVLNVEPTAMGHINMRAAGYKAT